jgi:hypothetical protein
MMQRILHGLRADLYLLREWICDWMEWQDAKEWAKCFHPGWVQIARKALRGITRKLYREKIIRAYRGENDG